MTFRYTIIKISNGGMMRKILAVIIILSSILISAEEYSGVYLPIYLRNPSLRYEASGKSNVVIPGDISSSAVNPALIAGIPSVGISYVYQDKAINETAENSEYGIGLSFGNFAFAWSDYESKLFDDSPYYDEDEYRNSVSRFTIAYKMNNLGIGISIAKTMFKINTSYLNSYYYFNADNIPEQYALDMGIYNRFNLVNTGAFAYNIDASAGILNAKAFEFGKIYNDIVLPRILNMGISNEFCFGKTQDDYSILSVRLNAAYTVYLNASNLYHYGFGGEVSLFDYLFFTAGKYWIMLMDVAGDDVSDKLAYGVGANLDLQRLLGNIPLNIRFLIARTPTLPEMSYEDSVSTGTGISLEAGYKFL